MKDDTMAPNGDRSYPLPTSAPQSAPQPALHNSTGPQSGPPKSNLVDTAPRTPQGPTVTEKPDITHNK